MRSDGSVQSFLASIGVGGDFGKYCGELDGRLTSLIDALISLAEFPTALGGLVEFLKQFGARKDWPSERYPKARCAVLTAMSLYRDDFVTATSQREVEDVEGRLQQICAALRQKNVLLLPGGALERYLPSFAGDYYKITNEAKNSAIEGELQILARGLTQNEMASRYGALFDLVCCLPSKAPAGT